MMAKDEERGRETLPEKDSQEKIAKDKSQP